jgi:hypothetical protein
VNYIWQQTVQSVFLHKLTILSALQACLLHLIMSSASPLEINTYCKESLSKFCWFWFDLLPLATFRTIQFRFASVIYKRNIFLCFKCKHSGNMLNITVKEVISSKYRTLSNFIKARPIKDQELLTSYNHSYLTWHDSLQICTKYNTLHTCTYAYSHGSSETAWQKAQQEFAN